MTTRMRHPAEDVTGEINIPDEAVSMHRMSGWLTDDEWTRAGLPEPPEPEPDEEDADDEPQEDVPDAEPGEQKRKTPRRSRQRATSEGNED